MFCCASSNRLRPGADVWSRCSRRLSPGAGLLCSRSSRRLAPGAGLRCWSRTFRLCPAGLAWGEYSIFQRRIISSAFNDPFPVYSKKLSIL